MTNPRCPYDNRELVRLSNSWACACGIEFEDDDCTTIEQQIENEKSEMILNKSWECDGNEQHI